METARTTIYLDNAATTPLEPRALEAMLPILQNQFGNPSSLHSMGRQTKVLVEQARKTVAALLDTKPANIYFTSGGTEADNTVLWGAVQSLGVKHIITSPIEHHAVLHTAHALEKAGFCQVHELKLDEKGNISLDHLEQLLSTLPAPVLVSLMHGNNEIGNLNDLEAIGTLVRKYNGYFHSDTVQTVGHFELKLSKLPVDFIAGAAHKFHGPKGTGFLYVGDRVKISAFIHGGAQERNMRGGTENVAGIVGMAKALEVACHEMADHRAHVEQVKTSLRDQLLEAIPGVRFNGESANLDKSLYTVLSVNLPEFEGQEMLLFRLDIAGICASGGSACSSGSEVGSHVLNALNPGSPRPSVRFSFSKYTQLEDLPRVVQEVAAIVGVAVPA